MGGKKSGQVLYNSQTQTKHSASYKSGSSTLKYKTD